MRQLFISQSLFKITRSSTAVNDNIIITSRNTGNRHPQQFMGLLSVNLRRIKRTEILLLKRIVQFVHQILKADNTDIVQYAEKLSLMLKLTASIVKEKYVTAVQQIPITKPLKEQSTLIKNCTKHILMNMSGCMKTM